MNKGRIIFKVYLLTSFSSITDQRRHRFNQFGDIGLSVQLND